MYIFTLNTHAVKAGIVEIVEHLPVRDAEFHSHTHTHTHTLSPSGVRFKTI